MPNRERFFIQALILQRHLWSIGRNAGYESIEDLLPDAGVAPVLVATVDHLPGAEVGGDRATTT
jgi:hypothetical protein